MTEHSFTVTAIHCAGCAGRIESGLRRLDGVRRVAVDVESKVVSVRSDEHRLDLDAVAEQLERLGFPVDRSGEGR